MPGGSAGACTSANKGTESESSSNSSDSESDSHQESSTPSTSYCTLCDDESVGAMHSAISSGDFGQVAQLKAKRQLRDQKSSLFSLHTLFLLVTTSFQLVMLVGVVVAMRLNGLAMLQYHHDILLTADEVVQEYVCRHPQPG